MATHREQSRSGSRLVLRFSLTLAALVAVVSVCAPAVSGSPKGADRERLERARDRAERLDQDRDARSSRISRTRAEARIAGLAEMRVLARLERSARKKRMLVLRLGQARRELEVAMAREERAVGQLSDRLVDIYLNPQPDYVGWILGADSFEELQTTARYLEALREADQQAALRVRQIRLEIGRRHGEIEQTKRELERGIADLVTQKRAFAAARDRARDAIGAMVAAQRRTTGALESARGEVARLRAEINGAPLYGGGPYSIPTYIVMCESGGNYRALNPSSGAGGAYQILPSTWRAYGGRGLPHLASKAEQDRIAALIWRDSGPSAWVCA